MKKQIYTFTFLSLFILMTGCSSDRYQYINDHQADDMPPLAHIEDAIPRYEAHSSKGNKNYRLRGINYKVFTDIDALLEYGHASWYGNKFHGHLTANGERYDMFAMSAAHKHLPLPSYVKVTNLNNNKTVIVRVNDRGPFHEGRVIDLSYAAANKLDIIKSGTAQVKIELIHFSEEQDAYKNAYLNGYFYVQYLVTSQEDKAKKLATALSEKYQLGHTITQEQNNYQLRLGPLSSEQQAQKILLALQKEYRKAFIIHQKIR